MLESDERGSDQPDSASADPTKWIESINWNERGLLPVIAQENSSKDVLMMAWMNREALLQTVATGQAIYWSRSRARLWRKGESSGHIQQVLSLHLDCDGDTLLLVVNQVGGIACHTGTRHCFFRQLDDNNWVRTEQALRDPGEIYSE